MYGIFTSICLIFMVNVGKYTIHGSYAYIFTVIFLLPSLNATEDAPQKAVAAMMKKAPRVKMDSPHLQPHSWRYFLEFMADDEGYWWWIWILNVDIDGYGSWWWWWWWWWWCMMHDAWCMMHDAWCMMHDAWCMMHDAWCMMHDAWCMVHGAWCMMHDAWCMMHACCSCFTGEGPRLQEVHSNFSVWLTLHYYTPPEN